jgi:hypothetical protein
MKKKIMTMVFSEEDDQINVTTKMHAQVSGKQMMSVMRTTIQGMIRTAQKIAGPDVSEDALIAYLFDGGNAVDNSVPVESKA